MSIEYTWCVREICVCVKKIPATRASKACRAQKSSQAPFLSVTIVLPSPPLTLLFSFFFLSIVQRSRLSYLCCLTLFFVSALHRHLDSFITAMAVHGTYMRNMPNSHMAMQRCLARVALLLDPIWFENVTLEGPLTSFWKTEKVSI